MKIGILQTGHSPDNMKDALGDYGDMFVKLLGGHGFDFQIWSVVDGDFPASAVDADGWLITGSKHGAYEDHDWIPPLEQLIRAIRDGAQDTVNQAGQQIVQRQLQVAPTLTIRPGFPVRIICNSFFTSVSRLVSRRICSSTSNPRCWASSIMSTLRRSILWLLNKNWWRESVSTFRLFVPLG